MTFSKLGRFFVLLTIILVSAGCSQDGLSTLTGIVMIDGKPAPKGIGLEFVPAFEGGSPAYASTDDQGRYEAQFTADRAGILPGEHSVKLMPGSSESSSIPELGPDGKPLKPIGKGPLSSLPRSYWQEVEKLTIKPGKNTHDIQLKSS